MFKIKNKTAFLLGFGFSCLLALPVLATDFGLKATGDAAGLTRSDTIPTITGNLIGAGLSLIGVLFFALMLFGGVTWMLSRGNQEMEKKALNTITGAIIGIIIVVASYAITSFVFQGIEGKTSSGGTTKTCASVHPDWSCKQFLECNAGIVYGDIAETGATWEKGLCPVSDQMCCGEAMGGGGESCHAGSQKFDDFCSICNVGVDICTSDDDLFVYCVGFCSLTEGECKKNSVLNTEEVECQKILDEDECKLTEADTQICEWK